MSLPTFVDEKIRAIYRRTEISREEITRDYTEIFEDPFIQEDPQFTTDEERHRYAVAVLWTRYVSRPPVKEFEIIPVGISGERITSTGKKTAEAYALVKGNRGVKLRRIVLQGPMADMRKEITLNAKYNVKLGEFSKGGDMIADNRSRFTDPVRLRLTPHELLDKIPGVKRIQRLKDAEEFPSIRGSDGYLDRTDWRVVRGIITREYRGERENGTEFGVYTITDLTLDEEPKVTSDGRVLQPGFTVWTPPELMTYSIESECDFCGTISIDRKTREPSMNAFLIIPVHARRIAGE